jgi:hypothetical protein
LTRKKKREEKKKKTQKKREEKRRNGTKMNFEVSFQSSLASGLFSRLVLYSRHCLLDSPDNVISPIILSVLGSPLFHYNGLTQWEWES